MDFYAPNQMNREKYSTRSNSCLLSLVVILSLPGLLQADPIQPDLSGISEFFADSVTVPPDDGPIDHFENFTVTPDHPDAGEQSDYILEFEINLGDFLKLDKGGFGFFFPDQFDISSAVVHSIEDDFPTLSYTVERTKIRGQVLFVYLKRIRDNNDRDNMVRVSLKIGGVVNPVQSGFYQLAATAFDKKLRLIVGPGMSESFEITQETVAEVQIIEVTAIAPNSPHVNTGQVFEILCKVANLSDNLIDSLSLRLTTDGASTFEPIETVTTVAAGDTASISFTVTAGKTPSDHELFEATVASPNLSPLPPIDKNAHIIIQSPARLELTYRLIGAEQGVVLHGDQFTFAVLLENSGTASTLPGSYHLSTGDVDFGDAFEDSGTIEVDRMTLFDFTAPSFDTSVVFKFDLLELPLDRNIALPAEIDRTFFEQIIRVESADGDLRASIRRVGLPLLRPGRPRKMLELELRNRTRFANGVIKLEEFPISFFDDRGDPLNVIDHVNIDQTGFYVNDQLVTLAEVRGHTIMFSFQEVFLDPGAIGLLTFIGRFDRGDLKTVTLMVDLAEIGSVYSDGPLAGLSPAISAENNQFLHSFKYVFTGRVPEEPIIVEKNPFNPEKEPLRFSYELTLSSSVEFRVLTLTGEEAYRRNIPSGQEGAKLGENLISWDGRNNSGHLVLNGVYIVSIKIVASGEQQRIKVAVIK